MRHYSQEKRSSTRHHPPITSMMLVSFISAVLLASASYANTVAYWRFEEGGVGTQPVDQGGASGPPWPIVDSSGNAYNMGVLASSNAPTYSALVPAATVAGSGAANTRSLDFGGSPQEIYARGYTPGLNDIDLASSWTVETSFRLDTITTGQTYGILTKQGKPVSNKGEPPLLFRVRTDGDPDDDDNTPNVTPYLEIRGLDGSGDDWRTDSRLDAPLVAGQWYNAAVVYNGTTADLYFDSGSGYRWQSNAALKTSGWYDSTDDWVIGRGAWNGAPAWSMDGQVDEVRISDVALPQQQFLYNDPSDFADLVSYTIDPAQSHLTVSGNIAGFDLWGQGIVGIGDPENPDPNGTLTTALGGNITAHLNGNTLTFDDLSDLDLQPNPAAPLDPELGSTVFWWDPDANGGSGATIETTFPSTGEENLGFDITPGISLVDVGAFRNTSFGISWGSSDFGAPATGVEWRAKVARFDFHSELQESLGETGAGSDLQDDAPVNNSSTENMTRTDDGTTETITIPFVLELPNSFEGMVFEGQIVATRSLVEGTSGDFDEDGDVDGADFLVWQRGFGSTYTSTDLANWQANFGDMGLAAAASAVPEPSSLVLVLMLGLVPPRRRRRS